MRNQPISGNSATSPAQSAESRADGLLTPTELASVLKISIRTVRRWEQSGMPSHRHGRTARFPLLNVRKWMTENKIKSHG